MNRVLSVTLPAGSIYVSGTVNGQAVTWTNTQGNTWEATAARSPDDIYAVDLTIIDSLGQSSTASMTLYYGLHLITDRVRADVDRVLSMARRGWSELTEAEQAQWLAGLKGAYNATDLNRVAAAVAYVAQRLAEAGIVADVDPKTDWGRADIPTPAQLEQYLTNIRSIRAALAVLPTTPEVPPRMTATEEGPGLNWSGANDLERILEDVDRLITNMIAAYRHCGVTVCGMEGLIV